MYRSLGYTKTVRIMYLCFLFSFFFIPLFLHQSYAVENHDNTARNHTEIQSPSPVISSLIINSSSTIDFQNNISSFWLNVPSSILSSLFPSLCVLNTKTYALYGIPSGYYPILIFINENKLKPLPEPRQVPSDNSTDYDTAGTSDFSFYLIIFTILICIIMISWFIMIWIFFNREKKLSQILEKLITQHPEVTGKIVNDRYSSAEHEEPEPISESISLMKTDNQSQSFQFRAQSPVERVREQCNDLTEFMNAKWKLETQDIQNYCSVDVEDFDIAIQFFNKVDQKNGAIMILLRVNPSASSFVTNFRDNLYEFLSNIGPVLPFQLSADDLMIEFGKFLSDFNDYRELLYQHGEYRHAMSLTRDESGFMQYIFVIIDKAFSKAIRTRKPLAQKNQFLPTVVQKYFLNYVYQWEEQEQDTIEAEEFYTTLVHHFLEIAELFDLEIMQPSHGEPFNPAQHQLVTWADPKTNGRIKRVIHRGFYWRSTKKILRKPDVEIV